MRRLSLLAAGAAMFLTSSPSLAAPCPASREEAQKFLAGLSRLGDERCFYPCFKSSKYDAAGLKILGVQPLAAFDKHERATGLSAVVFILPGALGKYAAAYKKAFPGGTCDSSGEHCYHTVQKAGENALRQTLLSFDVATKNTYFHCNFELMD